MTLQTMDDFSMIDFFQLNDLLSLIDKPTCYKNFDKSTCIDSILTSKLNIHFQHTNVSETGLSNFPLLVVTQFEMGLQTLIVIIKILIMITFRRI